MRQTYLLQPNLWKTIWQNQVNRVLNLATMEEYSLQFQDFRPLTPSIKQDITTAKKENLETDLDMLSHFSSFNVDTFSIPVVKITRRDTYEYL